VVVWEIQTVANGLAKLKIYPDRKGGRKSRKRIASRIYVSRVRKGPRGGKYVIVSGLDKKGNDICSYKLYVRRRSR